jgi:hypothetical protein
MPKKPEIKINVTRFTQDEVIEAVMQECGDFKFIPSQEQWVMALYSIGQTPAVISSITGRSEEGIQRAVDRYGKMTSQLPDGAKSKLNQRMVWNALGSYISVITDKKKIDAMKPLDAFKVAESLPGMLRELMKIEEEYREHKAKMKTLDMTDFKKMLELESEGELSGKTDLTE